MPRTPRRGDLTGHLQTFLLLAIFEAKKMWMCGTTPPQGNLQETRET
jgi:hypothetical protein